MIYNIFDTLEEAKTAQEYDFQKLISKQSNPNYVASTIRFAEITERQDGKFCYPACAGSDKVYTTEQVPEEE